MYFFSFFILCKFIFLRNECPGLCWHRPGHSLGKNIKLHEMKNEKTTWVFLVTKIWQILKRSSRALSWAQTSYFWRVYIYFFKDNFDWYGIRDVAATSGLLAKKISKSDFEWSLSIYNKRRLKIRRKYVVSCNLKKDEWKMEFSYIVEKTQDKSLDFS